VELYVQRSSFSLHVVGQAISKGPGHSLAAAITAKEGEASRSASGVRSLDANIQIPFRGASRERNAAEVCFPVPLIARHEPSDGRKIEDTGRSVKDLPGPKGIDPRT
jgi:hypothetical protein